MKIAVEGCAHGELEIIYECVETLQQREGIQIDLLICCGDFQAVRNKTDLCAMAVPEKYHNMCTFYKYYSGEKKAPILTLFIGGNHEASNFLQELPYGGWVAPNVYYLGRAGVIQFGDLRIGGLSGIFKERDYFQGLWECPPYTQYALRSVYHIRSLDVFRLSQLKDKVHVMLSHDWPRCITDHGNKEELLKFKPFFRGDIEANQLGSIPAEKLLNTLKPDYWFSAHLHCKFVALVKHENGCETQFLALDKCLPRRRHLQILDVPSELDGDKTLKFDAEWLAILRSTNHLLSVTNKDCHMPGVGGDERYDFTPTNEEKEAVVNKMKDMAIEGDSFKHTAPIFNINAAKVAPSEPILNPQTVKLCDTLGIDDPVQVITARTWRTMKEPGNCGTVSSESRHIETEATPPVNVIKRSKLLLPAPMTPSEDDNEKLSQEVTCPENVLLTGDLNTTDDCKQQLQEVDNTADIKLSDFTTTDECATPTPATRKTFKRRNASIYNTPDQDSDEGTVSTLIDSESSSCKLANTGKT